MSHHNRRYAKLNKILRKAMNKLLVSCVIKKLIKQIF